MRRLIGFTADGGLIVMYASTNVLTALEPFSPCPLVSTVIGLAVPRSDSVLVAWPVTLPGADDVNVIVQTPFAFVPLVHVLLETSKLAPLALESATVTGSFAAGTQPVALPRSFSTSTVKV